MRFERVHIDRFGGLQDVDTGQEALPSLVVVTGPNEAGKSSFFSFLSSALYGFHPATRVRNPYAPWSDDDIEGSTIVRLDGGERIEVHRRLLSAGWGRLRRNGSVVDLRNQPVPWAHHVPRAVFGQIYALTLSELAGLAGESWREIQHRFASGPGVRDLRPVRDAVRDLDAEAGALWRPGTRGQSKARDLRGRLKELREARGLAELSDVQVRTAAKRLEQAESRLQAVIERRDSVRAESVRVRRLLPVVKELARIRRLLEEGGPPQQLKNLPSDPEARLTELRKEHERLKGRMAELDSGAAEARASLDGSFERDAAVLANQDAIQSLFEHLVSVEDARPRLSGLDEEKAELEQRTVAVAREVFVSPWEQVSRSAVAQVSTDVLHRRIREYMVMQEERVVRQEMVRRLRRRPDAKQPSARWEGWVGTAIVLLGVALAVAGVRNDDVLVLALGALASVPGLFLAGRQWGANRRASQFLRELTELRTGVKEAERREVDARKHAVELATELPLQSRHFLTPDLDLPGRISTLQELLRSSEAIEAERSRLAGHLSDAHEALDVVRHLTGASLPPDFGAAVHLLRAALRSAERRGAAALAAERDIEGIGKERSEVTHRAAVVADELRELEETIRQLGEGDVDAGLKAVRSRRQALSAATRISRELVRACPDLDALREEISAAQEAKEAWLYQPSPIDELQAREEALSEEVEELLGRVRTLESEMGHLTGRPKTDEVDGEVADVRDRLRRVGRERDRRRLLALLLEEAERRFREGHEPGLNDRAGAYLATITGGRYDRVLVSGEGRAEAFFVDGPSLEEPLEVAPPLSTGTREQIYLTLRLAALDDLDASGERLPLFIDEAFVNWDQQRRGRGFDLLKEVSEVRQVFVFTCHELLVGELVERGARVLRVGDEQ